MRWRRGGRCYSADVGACVEGKAGRAGVANWAESEAAAHKVKM